MTPRLYDRVDMAEQVVRTFIERGEEVYFDLETTGLDPRNGKIVAVQLKQGERTPVIFDVRDRPEVVRALAPLFSGSGLRIIGHNIKFDLGWLRQYGIRSTSVYDTQIAEQVLLGLGLSEARKLGMGVNLLDTAARYGIEVSKEERSWFIDLDQQPDQWNSPFPDEQIAYMAQDVEVLPTIRAAQIKEINRLKLREVVKIEMRTLPALVEMEYAGIHIDVDGWRAFIKEKEGVAGVLADEVLAELGAAILAVRIEKYDAEMRVYQFYRDEIESAEQNIRFEWDALEEEKGWGEFKKRRMEEWRANHTVIQKPKLDTAPPNLDSPTQLIAGLERLGVPVPTKKNLKGERVRTTDSKSLETVDHPVAARLMAYRKATKFVQSFGEALLKHAGEDGRIHPDYNQIGAGTGRMSCERPNWQQVPSKGDGKKLRELVKAPPGYLLGTADFSNIELRILANLTGDAVMIDAFNRGLDLHSETAKRMFGLPDDWDKDRCEKEMWKRDLSYRSIAKIINFMLVYGGSPFKLAMEIGIEVKEAERLVESYFKAYPGVRRWMARTRDEAHQNHRTLTLTGRRRSLPDAGPEPHAPVGIKNPDKLRKAWAEHEEKLREWKKRRARAERQALNTPIQGLSADITKLALALFSETVTPEVGRLVACVHDEIVVEAREDCTGVVEEALKAAMKAACDRYLKLSPVPAPKVSWADHWVKD